MVVIMVMLLLMEVCCMEEKYIEKLYELLKRAEKEKDTKQIKKYKYTYFGDFEGE